MKTIKEELLKWTCKTHATNSYLDRRMLREKALEFSRMRGLNGFKCSERWLNCFLREYGFSHDLADHTGPTFTNYRDWIDLMRSTIIKYKHNDLFHVDELSMYTDVLPLRISSEEIENEPPSNRVTILLGCNSSGNTKLPLLVCGTYPSKITVQEHVYCHSEDSYIDDQLFKKWLSDMNERMFKSNRKILVFLRRNRAHTLKDFAPSNLKLVYLPQNFPPLLRPLRKDVFYYLKMIFRRRYVERLRQSNEKWNVRDTFQSLIEAWEAIPREIIVFNFQKTHFRTDDCLLQIDCDCWDSLKVGISFKRFVTFDDNLSDEQPFYGRQNKHCNYNLRVKNKNVIRIDEDNLDPLELSPWIDRNYQVSSEVRNHVNEKLNRAWKEEHHNARRNLLKNSVIENKSHKRAHSETRFSAMIQQESKKKNIKTPFVIRDSNATSSRSTYGKPFKHEEESQRQQTETDTTRESLQVVENKALALTSLKVNLNDMESFDRQEVSNLEKRPRPSEDDSSADEPNEKKSKMDQNWTKQFETNFVFGSQSTNCSMGLRHDDKAVESCIFNVKPSVSPKD